MVPEGTDREVLREKVMRAIWSGQPGGLSGQADALVLTGHVGVYDPATHVAVPRDLLQRMAAVCTYGGPFTDDEAELIERWSE